MPFNLDISVCWCGFRYLILAIAFGDDLPSIDP